MDVNIDRRKELFENFRNERLPVLFEFSSDLEFENPHEILLTPENYLSGIDSWLSEQKIKEEDKVWLATRIGYYIGELFAVKYNGCWSVCEVSDSRYYGQYIVGEFDKFNNQFALLNPIEAAIELVNESEGRSLISLVNEITAALEKL